MDRPRTASLDDSQRGSLLGPEFSDAQIALELAGQAAVAHRMEGHQQLCDRVARLIAGEQVVGWFQGRMEFGPRALGGRSILGDARSPNMQSIMNLKIKLRESFRPFAPIVLKDQVDKYFEMGPIQESPYMQLVAPVRAVRRRGVPENQTAFGLERLKQIRSDIPAVTHVDYSARIQTVDADRNPLLYQLLTRFHELTGCGVMINTSFNIRSEPIVCTPLDAYRCFMMTDMDALAIGNFLLLKSEQTTSTDPCQRRRYLNQFELD
jgi:carbamoyltransferase